MADETPDARMERLLRTLPPALRGMGFGDPDDVEYAHASDVVAWAIAEIARLREERLTAGEREALELSLELEWPKTSEQWKALAACLGPVCVAPANKHKVAIRGLLNRMPLPPGPDPKEANRE